MDNGAGSYRRFLNGDESAVGEIMEELFYGLVFFVDRYVHDVHTAEDIALDVMSDLFVYKRRYDFSVPLKTYVFMLGRSRALDELKHRRVKTLVGLEEAADVSDEREDLLEKVIANERRRKVDEAVSKLPEDMRTAVHLVYFEDMSYNDAAKVMKKNAKQIDNLLYRAKNELKSELSEEIL